MYRNMYHISHLRYRDDVSDQLGTCGIVPAALINAFKKCKKALIFSYDSIF